MRASKTRWRSLVPADYGEQVHCVAAGFAILEAALLLGEPGCRMGCADLL